MSNGDYIVTRDGEPVTAPFAREIEAIGYLLRAQSQSWRWAVQHGGWDIIYPDGTRLSEKQKG